MDSDTPEQGALRGHDPKSMCLGFSSEDSIQYWTLLMRE
jgi:hypothetical protein